MQTVRLPGVEIDHSILLSLKSSADELVEKMRFFTALALYQRNKLSLGKSAEFAGMGRLDFIKALQDNDIPVFDYKKEEIKEIYEDAKALSDSLG